MPQDLHIYKHILISIDRTNHSHFCTMTVHLYSLTHLFRALLVELNIHIRDGFIRCHCSPKAVLEPGCITLRQRCQR